MEAILTCIARRSRRLFLCSFTPSFILLLAIGCSGPSNGDSTETGADSIMSSTTNSDGSNTDGTSQTDDAQSPGSTMGQSNGVGSDLQMGTTDSSAQSSGAATEPNLEAMPSTSNEVQSGGSTNQASDSSGMQPDPAGTDVAPPDSSNSTGGAGGQPAGDSGGATAQEDAGVSDTSNDVATGGAGGAMNNPLGAPQVYIDNCADCHGVDAKGTAAAPEIEHAAATLVDYYVRNGDNNEWGGPDRGCVEDTTDPNYATRGCDKWGSQLVMTTFDQATVSDADVAAIKDWLDGLPMPTTGDALYADFCAYCHGPGGDIPTFTYYVKSSALVAGVELWDPDPSQPSAKDLLTVVKDGLIAQPPDRRDAYMPPFAAKLTDDEILLIARWMCTQDYANVPGFCSDLPM